MPSLCPTQILILVVLVQQMLAADVIIVGGGIAGVAAAYTTLQRSETATVLLLEAKVRLGGRLFSETLSDVPLVYEHGAH